MKETIIMIVLVVVVLLLMVVMPMLSRKKQQKELVEFQKKIGVGTKVMTAGGIIGTILSINENTGGEKEFTLETGEGNNKSTLTFNFRAIYSVISNPVAAAPAKVAEPVAVEEKAEEVAENVENKAE